MRVVAIPNPGATVLLAAFFLLMNVGAALYAAAGQQPSGAFAFLTYVGFSVAVAWWIKADSRTLGVRESVDQGLLVYIAWPLFLPYHLFKTRGARGGLTLLGLIGLFGLTYAVAVLVYYGVRNGGVS